MIKKIWVIILALFFSLPVKAQASEDRYNNNASINLLAIPVGNLVISYEYYSNRQSVWFGGEHHFNGIFKEEDKSLNSIALEYRRYFSKNLEVADGLFAGLYSKYRVGQEILVENTEFSHSYHAVFAGLNVGYQYHINRWVLSVFTGYGIPVYLTEEGNTNNGETELNKGYNRDLRLGLTVGFAF
ncbi:MAG: hypothetical protein WD577_03965 [Bacteroidales bacterium]